VGLTGPDVLRPLDRPSRWFAFRGLVGARARIPDMNWWPGARIGRSLSTNSSVAPCGIRDHGFDWRSGRSRFDRAKERRSPASQSLPEFRRPASVRTSAQRLLLPAELASEALPQRTIHGDQATRGYLSGPDNNDKNAPARHPVRRPPSEPGRMGSRLPLCSPPSPGMRDGGTPAFGLAESRPEQILGARFATGALALRCVGTLSGAAERVLCVPIVRRITRGSPATSSEPYWKSRATGGRSAHLAHPGAALPPNRVLRWRARQLHRSAWTCWGVERLSPLVHRRRIAVR
jgi:hypothetical protein